MPCYSLFSLWLGRDQNTIFYKKEKLTSLKIDTHDAILYRRPVVVVVVVVVLVAVVVVVVAGAAAGFNTEVLSSSM